LPALVFKDLAFSQSSATSCGEDTHPLGTPLGDLRTLGTPLGVLLSVIVRPLAELLHHRGYIAAAEYPRATLARSLTIYSIVAIVHN
jgi:hypothetical protein